MFSAAVLVAALAQGEVAGQQPLDGVRDLLKATQAVTVFDHVAASAADGIVTLTGKVTSKSKRDQLETEVATVPGVRQVVNRIGVLSASAADDALRHRVARAIYGHASFRRYAAMTQPPIRILVDGGRVTLAGEVRTAVERLVALSLAAEAAGSRVDDQLRETGV
jgi:osmotically-inducible protein OsmY